MGVHVFERRLEGQTPLGLWAEEGDRLVDVASEEKDVASEGAIELAAVTETD